VDRPPDGAAPHAGPAPHAGSAPEVFAVALRLGLTSFGGPVAHLGYQRATYVDRRRWLDEATFADIVALCQTLPGPASTQLMIAVGRLRAGWPGAFAAWLGFTLPSAVLMAAVGIGVAGAAVPGVGPVAGAVAGLKVAAVAVVAQAVLVMGRRLTPDAPRLVLAGLAAAVLLAVPAALTQVVLIVAGATIGRAAWRLGGRTPAGTVSADADARVPGRRGISALPEAGTRRTVTFLLATFVLVVVGSQLVAIATGDEGARFTAALVRAGALVFGGGHVVLPLLDEGVVAPGWVTPDQFLAGYGIAQAMPGPLFAFAAYLGAVASAGPGGVAGAAIGTVAIFLPGALLVLAALPVLGRLRSRPAVAAALTGVNAVVVGILAAALVTPVATTALTSPLAVLVAVAGTAGLVSGRIPPLAVVAGSAAVMALVAGAGI
jgi:chromate transporter